MTKAKTKRICGLELHKTGYLGDGIRYIWEGHAGGWHCTRHIGKVQFLTSGKTPRSAVAKLLRLEERVLKELLKGRVE